MDWIGAVVRFVVSALVLMLVGLIVPGFGTLGFLAGPFGSHRNCSYGLGWWKVSLAGQFPRAAVELWASWYLP